jgi:hypothetical protein
MAAVSRVQSKAPGTLTLEVRHGWRVVVWVREVVECARRREVVGGGEQGGSSGRRAPLYARPGGRRLLDAPRRRLKASCLKRRQVSLG